MRNSVKTPSPELQNRQNFNLNDTDNSIGTNLISDFIKRER